MSTYAPIALFVYNRPQHAACTVEALLKNEFASDSALHIFSDGPRNHDDQIQVDAVRRYLNTIQGFKSLNVVIREKNNGLAQSIISGVTEVCAQYGRVIVLEDDITTSPYFLRYMNDALRFYADEDAVGAISGHLNVVEGDLPETFFLRHANCLGWATWQRAWNLFNPDSKALLAELEQRGESHAFDFYGSFPYTSMLRRQGAANTDLWAIRWYATLFLRNKFSLYPGRSLTRHSGDQGGTFSTVLSNDVFECRLSDAPIRVMHRQICENEEHRAVFAHYYGHVFKKKFWASLREKHKAAMLHRPACSL